MAGKLLGILAVLVVLMVGMVREAGAEKAVDNWWEVRSIDTMKYSRDLARAKLKDPAFNSVIDTQMKNIAGTGATHAAIGTPYDEEFRPILARWVAAARKYGLKVWFRGNWSGWEGWFGYPRITESEHIAKTVEFINKNREIFADGDIFTACPECENGQIGDPRNTGDADGYRKFLIAEYQATKKAFGENHQLVPSNYNSMNADVARLIMDKTTTAALDGLVVIDHYVASGQKLATDIKEIADRSGGQVVLGEIGVPIPDIHGFMSEEQQAAWMDETMSQLTPLRQLSGLNYWVNVGGTTSLWEATGPAKKAAGIVKNYYSPQVLTLKVTNEANQKIDSAEVAYHGRIFYTDRQGTVTFPLDPHDNKMSVGVKDYKKSDLVMAEGQSEVEVVLVKTNESWMFKLQKFIAGLGVKLGMWQK